MSIARHHGKKVNIFREQGNKVLGNKRFISREWGTKGPFTMSREQFYFHRMAKGIISKELGQMFIFKEQRNKGLFRVNIGSCSSFLWKGNKGFIYRGWQNEGLISMKRGQSFYYQETALGRRLFLSETWNKVLFKSVYMVQTSKGFILIKVGEQKYSFREH